MCTYARFEVSPDGELLQSSKIIPPSGILPRPQSTAKRPHHTKIYTESVISTTVTASIASDGEKLRIVGLYFPPVLSGWRLLYLLGPLLLIIVAIYLIIELTLTPYQVTPLAHTLLVISAALVVYMLVLLPAGLWARHLYTQSSPSAKVQRRIIDNYPDIPVFRDYHEFMVDASTK